MQHPDEGTIHAWLDGALTADEAAGVEAHVKQCAQCQAAVAEARGFIAASSRILTALDNAPRGVLPAAQPKKGIAPWVWRVAATVLVVAAGTLVVVRKTGVNQSLSANAPLQAVQRTNASSRSPESAAPTAAASPATTDSRVMAPSNQGTESPKVFRVVPRAIPPVVERRPADAGEVTSGLRTDRQQNQKIAVAGGSARIAAPGAAAPSPAAVRAPTLSAAAPQRFGGGTANVAAASSASAADMTVAAEQSGVRSAGNRRAIGQKITLYEVAPGDTVEFAEHLPGQLESVVVTGLSAQVARGQAKSPAMPPAPGKVSAPTADTSATMSASASGESASSRGVNTITWTDSAGKVISLSGRHTTAELQQIRQRIEQSRAAARADSLRKSR